MGGKSKADKGKALLQNVVNLTWQEKKAIIDKQEDALEQEIQEQQEWISMIKDMDNEDMKIYLSNRPDCMRSKSLETPCETSKRMRRKGVNGKTSAASNTVSTVWMLQQQDGK